MTAVVKHETAVNWQVEREGAAMLLKSGLAPQGLKTPEAAMFVILVGRDLGLTPTQSLRSINVISGKVEVAADMQLALFKRAGGRATWARLEALGAVLHLTHPNGDEHTETFTMEDARRAGLTGPNWSKYPKAMLRSRCITAGMKSVGFDALAGVYAEGEIGGEEPTLTVDATTEAPAVPVEPQTPATVTVDAEVVDTATGEVLASDADEIDAALAFNLPFGKSKGIALEEMETFNLDSALAWAEGAAGKGRYADFCAAAKVVLAWRKAEKPHRVQESESGGIGNNEELAPALASRPSDQLPF